MARLLFAFGLDIISIIAMGGGIVNVDDFLVDVTFTAVLLATFPLWSAAHLLAAELTTFYDQRKEQCKLM